MSEALAYARCHGARRRNVVGVVKVQPREPAYDLLVSGEALRQAFEAKLLERAL
jgi:hypothetical protein